MAQAGPSINGASAKGLLGCLAKRALNTLLPPQFLGCRAQVDTPGVLCSRYWGDITFLGPPQCDVCGLPFDYDLGEGALCGALHTFTVGGFGTMIMAVATRASFGHTGRPLTAGAGTTAAHVLVSVVAAARVSPSLPEKSPSGCLGPPGAWLSGFSHSSISRCSPGPGWGRNGPLHG